MEKSIKEYTKYISEKFNLELEDKDIDRLMFSFGFLYNQKCEVKG